jgi:LPXTG-site transpeptidase (sortase) family protein
MLRQIVHYYKPKQTLTLYDQSLHSFCRGVLYLNKYHTDQEVQKSHNFRKLALACMLFFMLSILVFSVPIVLAQIQASSAKLFTQAPAKTPKPDNVYSSNYLLDNVYQDNSDFTLYLPSINLESHVIAGVNAQNEDQYKPELMKGIAQASDSYLPGQGGPVFLFAHSTDSLAHIEQYNAKFYALKDVALGDTVRIHFRGKDYQYIVTGKTIINPDQLDVIRNSNAGLILSTCWPPGTSWQRILIFANPLGNPSPQTNW